MTLWNVVQTAGPWVWGGMVFAISFVEAPLKFRAPGITVELGVGIGRLVFRALNGLELALALAVGVALLVGGDDSTSIWITWTVAATMLVAKDQLRRAMDRRSQRPPVPHPSPPTASTSSTCSPRSSPPSHWEPSAS